MPTPQPRQPFAGGTPNRVHLIKPNGVKGFASAQPPLALGPGLVSVLNDIRLSDGVPQARWGAQSVLASIGSGLMFRGGADITQDGLRCLFVAALDTSTASAGNAKVRVFKSTNTGLSFTEITASSGPYGDTRLNEAYSTTPGDSPKPVFFQLATDQGRISTASVIAQQPARDLLYMQNGVDPPRVYAKNFSLAGYGGFGAAYGTSVVYQAGQPGIDIKSVATFKNFMDIAHDTAMAMTPSAHMSPSNASLVSGENYIQLTVGAAAAPAEQATAVLATSGHFLDTNAHGGSSTIMFQVASSGANSTVDDWQQVGLEMGDGSNWYQIWPSNQTPYIVDTGGTGGYLTNSIQQVQLTIPAGISTKMSQLRFTSPNTPLGRAFTLSYYMIAGGGPHTMATNFGVAYYQSDTRTLGPGRIMTGGAVGAPISACGGPAPANAGQVFSYVNVNSAGFYWFDVDCAPCTSADLSHGVDFALLYRNDSGTSGYYLVDAYQTAVYSGTWLSGVGSRIGPFVLPSNAVNYGQLLPDGGETGMPAGTAMATANGRTFVLSGSRCYFSEWQQPSRYRTAARPASGYSSQVDAFSAAAWEKPGETLQAIVSMAAETSQANGGDIVPQSGTVLILSDRNAWYVSGNDCESLSFPRLQTAHGTRSPFSIARSRNYVYWLTDEGQVCRIGGAGAQLLSLYKVDDQMSGIPAARRMWAWGAFMGGRYYLSYGPSATNAVALVFNENIGEFESIDRFPSPMTSEAMFAAYDDLLGYTRLICVSAGAGIYEHSVPGRSADLSGAGVGIAVTFPEVADFAKNIDAAGWSCVADVGGSLTTAIVPSTGRTAGTSLSQVLSLAGKPAETKTRVITPSGKGLLAMTILPSLSGTIPGGNHLYDVSLEIETAQEGLSR